MNRPAVDVTVDHDEMLRTPDAANRQRRISAGTSTGVGEIFHEDFQPVPAEANATRYRLSRYSPRAVATQVRPWESAASPKSSSPSG